MFVCLVRFNAVNKQPIFMKLCARFVILLCMLWGYGEWYIMVPFISKVSDLNRGQKPFIDNV